MSIEDRLYVVVRESVVAPFSTYGELAQRVHDSEPVEFTYQRLEDKHVMQPISIIPYVSLLDLVRMFERNENEQYKSILDQPPTLEGCEELISQHAIEKLQEAGFT